MRDNFERSRYNILSISHMRTYASLRTVLLTAKAEECTTRTENA